MKYASTESFPPAFMSWSLYTILPSLLLNRALCSCKAYPACTGAHCHSDTSSECLWTSRRSRDRIVGRRTVVEAPGGTHVIRLNSRRRTNERTRSPCLCSSGGKWCGWRSAVIVSGVLTLDCGQNRSALHGYISHLRREHSKTVR